MKKKICITLLALTCACNWAYSLDYLRMGVTWVDLDCENCPSYLSSYLGVQVDGEGIVDPNEIRLNDEVWGIPSGYSSTHTIDAIPDRGYRLERWSVDQFLGQLDADSDGHLDVDEDLDGDGHLDVNEDVDGDGYLDPATDSGGNVFMGEDIDGDGHLDVDETTISTNSELRVEFSYGYSEPTSLTITAHFVVDELDPDGDGLSNNEEQLLGTNPLDFDSDDDGLSDGVEVNIYGSNPLATDSDSDGFNDGFEVSTGFDPASTNSTPELHSYIKTSIQYEFNAASGTTYRIEGAPNLSSPWGPVEDGIAGEGGVVTRHYDTDVQTNRFFRSKRD